MKKHNVLFLTARKGPLTTTAKSLVTFGCEILCEGTVTAADYAAEKFDLMESSRS